MWGSPIILLDNAGAYCPEQLVNEINALYLAIFSTYKIEHLINEMGIICIFSIIICSLYSLNTQEILD